MSVAEGIDCATPVRDAAALGREGKRFVCRYLSDDAKINQWKKLSLGEAQRIRSAGLAIVVVFETFEKRALDGFNAGRQDARRSLSELGNCGLPAVLPVYFAVDFDATRQQQAPINNYLRGAAFVLGKTHTGVYGSYYVVKRALDADVCKFAWQTYAWSGGQWDPRAQLQQYRNGVRLAGMEVDLDRATRSDYGQFPRPVQPKPDMRPAWAKRGDKLSPMWAWMLWRDHGAPANLRPKHVPARVPLWWFPRYALHRGVTPKARS